jgi:hypothetical protein
MVSANIINPEKKGKVVGHVFHVFYADLNTSYLYDRDLSVPIIWGSKNIVMTNLKKINEIAGFAETDKVRIYSYILDAAAGYRRVDTYNGPCNTIGKYIRRL